MQFLSVKLLLKRKMIKKKETGIGTFHIKFYIIGSRGFSCADRITTQERIRNVHLHKWLHMSGSVANLINNLRS